MYKGRLGVNKVDREQSIFYNKTRVKHGKTQDEKKKLGLLFDGR